MKYVNKDVFSDADFAHSKLLTGKDNISNETMPLEILEENFNIREPPQIQVLVDVHRAADEFIQN